ncbi:MAG: hypothetical protein J4F46_06160 [Dehalococcoidia bacterium]|nr:hypothetical protein [Dehalococcoidia bacterium]
MTLKVSINLPGDALITVEASEPQIFREVMSLALKELPKDLIQMRLRTPSPNETGEQGKNVSTEPPSRDAGPQLQDDSSTSDLERAESDPSPPETEEGDDSILVAEESFVRFCRAISPVGDMRRVVLAAEGARRHLGMSSVSESELWHLFDLAGWQQPGSFLQTLRNAARSKFRWLERIPGRPGYYAITQLGRDRVIGSDE